MFTLLQSAGQGAGMQSIIMIVIMFVIVYFFMIRPQSKRNKEIKAFRDSIKEGDEVITAGGIYGVVTTRDLVNHTICIKISNGVVIKVDEASIYSVGNKPANQ